MYRTDEKPINDHILKYTDLPFDVANVAANMPVQNKKYGNVLRVLRVIASLFSGNSPCEFSL